MDETAIIQDSASTDSRSQPDASQHPEPPDWLADAIWYQVFVSRFRNGESSNDPPGAVEWTPDWFRLLDGEAAPLRRRLSHRRHGGDLQGVIQAIPYFQSLGVNTLYLNPVFAAQSQHKYDTVDHRHVDDTFGVRGSLSRVAGETLDPATWRFSQSDRVFLDLIGKCHHADIRVVIDGVFNHVGLDFFGWRDVLAKGEKSQFAHWFDVIDWGPPIQYNAWDGPNGHLVEFRRDENGLDPDAEAYIFAVVKRWMDPDGDGDPSDGIDGWRLDVADKPPHAFWREFRRVAKNINPQASIIGEVWPDATAWLRGDQFDAVTNYRFRDPALQLVGRAKPTHPPTEFAEAIDKVIADHRWPVSLSMMNLLDSHDTGRAVTVLGMESNVETEATMQPPDESSLNRFKLAALLQFTMPGAPIIYYGDEIGMYGGNDPQCRAPMWWSERAAAPGGDAKLLTYFKSLCRLRQGHVALRRGVFQWVLVDDTARILAFRRQSTGDELMVILNLDDRPHTVSLNLGVDVSEVKHCFGDVNSFWEMSSESFPSREGVGRFRIIGRSGAIFEVRRKPVGDDD